MMAKMAMKLFNLCELQKTMKLLRRLAKHLAPDGVFPASIRCSDVRRASPGSHHTGNDPPLRQGWCDHCKKVSGAVQWTVIIFVRWDMQGKPLDLGVLICLWGYKFHFFFVRNNTLENNKARLCLHPRWSSFIRYQIALKTIQLPYNSQ